jgi:homoserine dehydrogenase
MTGKMVHTRQVILCGFGGVGRAFARLLCERRDLLHR